jgi:hypothetical protein
MKTRASLVKIVIAGFGGKPSSFMEVQSTKSHGEKMPWLGCACSLLGGNGIASRLQWKKI